MKDQVRISETFLSVNGETQYVGLPTYFIRFQGCSAKCSFCDTPFSLDIEGGTQMEIKDLVKEVVDSGCNLVCITGGEPLEQGVSLISLIKKLFEEISDVTVLIETNGTRSLALLTELRDLHKERLVVSMDLKPSGADLPDELYCQNLRNIRDLRTYDILKCLVGDQKDYSRAKGLFISLLQAGFKNIIVQPIYGKRNLATDVVKWLLKDKLFLVRFQLQMHKYIWSPSKRRV